MKKYLKLIYFIIVLLFIVLSFFEIKSYFTMYSNLFGLLYLIMTLIIIGLLIKICINFKKKNIIILIVILLGLTASFLLPNIINVMSYTDNSSDYLKNNYIIINIFKPIIYFILLALSIVEYKFIKH